ncbi:unnamed protein product, partial [Choristocarpus tenellus]
HTVISQVHTAHSRSKSMGSASGIQLFCFSSPILQWPLGLPSCGGTIASSMCVFRPHFSISKAEFLDHFNLPSRFPQFPCWLARLHNSCAPASDKTCRSRRR